jgi:kynureninase
LTGQAFELEKIGKAAHKMGAYFGVNLAHGVGNLELKLHDWDIDFAAWCTYKYLNSGPGNIGGFFLHEKYAYDVDLPRFCGWWGHRRETRFLPLNKFDPQPGAASFQLSNPPVLCMMTLLASLEIFDKATMSAIREKSLLITTYLEYLLDTEMPPGKITILTPRDPQQRGCQLSVRVHGADAYDIMQKLDAQGVVVDERKPDVIRISPAPLYNRFEEVRRLVTIFKKVVESL